MTNNLNKIINSRNKYTKLSRLWQLRYRIDILDRQMFDLISGKVKLSSIKNIEPKWITTKNLKQPISDLFKKYELAKKNDEWNMAIPDWLWDVLIDRMMVVEQIWQLKKTQSMEIFQDGRKQEVLANWKTMSKDLWIDNSDKFAEEFFHIIHSYSCNLQSWDKWSIVGS